jgi:hypothetical protein
MSLKNIIVIFKNNIWFIIQCLLYVKCKSIFTSSHDNVIDISSTITLSCEYEHINYNEIYPNNNCKKYINQYNNVIKKHNQYYYNKTGYHYMDLEYIKEFKQYGISKLFTKYSFYELCEKYNFENVYNEMIYCQNNVNYYNYYYHKSQNNYNHELQICKIYENLSICNMDMWKIGYELHKYDYVQIYKQNEIIMTNNNNNNNLIYINYLCLCLLIISNIFY